MPRKYLILPDKVKRANMRGEHGGNVRIYYGADGSKTLAVVAECKKDECWIITGYHEN